MSRKVIRTTPTLDTSAYSAADHMGTLMTLTDVLPKGSGLLESFTVVDKGKQNKGFTALFFSSAPTIASADNAALDITDAEMGSKFLGSVSVVTANYISISASGAASLKNIGLELKASSGGNLCVLLMADEAQTHSASDFVLSFGIRDDG